MFTATLTTLAAVTALNGPVVTANTTVLAATPSSDNTAAITIAAPPKPAVRIPGTFTVDPTSFALDGVQALYVVRVGDA